MSGGERGANFMKINCAERTENQEEAEDEAAVTDAIDDERFLTGVTGRLFEEIKSDQQITAKADAFPSDEHEQHVVGENQRENGEHEKIQVAKETVAAAFV